jgi:1-acyl-sn-glycerol-3-phosphate acyltransferase
VVVALHEGFADALALLHLPLALRFVARDELFDWPELGAVLHGTQQINVSPEAGPASLRTMLREAAPVFARGESLVVFAQGSILGLEISFRLGAFAVARHHARPILPVAISGSHRVWAHPFSPRLRVGERVSLRVLEPIRPEALTDLETARLNLQRTLKGAALEPGMAAPRRYDPHRDGFWDGYAFEIDPDFPALEAVLRTHRDRLARTSMR